MIQLALLVLAIALIYAAKVAAIMLTRDEMAGKSASFSWMAARAEDEATAASWAVEQAPASASEAHVAGSSLNSWRRAGGASA